MRFIFILTLAAIFVGAATAPGQQIDKSFAASAGAKVEVINHFGRIEVLARAESDDPAAENAAVQVSDLKMAVTSASGVSESELRLDASRSGVRIEVSPKDPKKRIDVRIETPPGARLKIDAGAGEVLVSGPLTSAEVRTDTGTIAANVPTDFVRYRLLWTASKPRFVSDFPLTKIKEKAAGKFQIEGSFRDPNAATASSSTPGEEEASDESVASSSNGKKKDEASGNGDGSDNGNTGSGNRVELKFETARGIILLNVPPNEISSDLRERPLTNAAKAIIRSGDTLLMDAIRRAAPEFYGDYARSLPPLKLEPKLVDRPNIEKALAASVKVASVRVSDVNNRAVDNLTAADFEVFESGAAREVVSVRRSTAPFNLVLLLDVSGSVDNYVNFIRKAARNFVNTVDRRDRVAIVTFNDDINVVSNFTTDKTKLSASLDSFDAGGPTAYYDALAYTLADTLRPLKGERTAIVVLTDGDDNRSFLPFDSTLSSIQESGALIYPLYVPSALVAAAQSDPNATMDSLRSRYLKGDLTSKAKEEGERLAKVSGGVYYEISMLSQIQAAYEDIVSQLRTSYDVEYRSELGGIDAGVSPRLRIRTRQPNTYVQIRSVDQRSAGK